MFLTPVLFKKSFCCFVFFMSAVLYSQPSKLDSLKTILDQHKKQDSIRLNILIEIGYYHYSSNPDEGLQVLDEAITLANKLKRKIDLAKAYQYKGHNYLQKGADSLAATMYDKAIIIYNEIGDKNRKARVLYNKGLIYFNQSNYKRANKNNLDAYLVFKEAKDSLLMAKMLNSIGLNFMYMSNYTLALTKYHEALIIHKKLKDTLSLNYADIEGSLGNIYSRLEKFDMAIKYHENSLKIYESQNNKFGIANCLTNIGNAYDYLKNPTEAITHYEKALSIMQDINNKRGVASALTNIGIAYISLNEYKKALTYLNQSKPIYKSLNNSNNLAIVHDHIGVCHLNYKSNIIKAKDNFEKSLLYAKSASSLNLQVNALNSLTRVNYKLGFYKKAYEQMGEAVILKDSFNSIEKNNQITRLEEKYKYENEKIKLDSNYEKERLIAREKLEQQKFIKKSIALGGGSLFCLVVGGMYFFRKKKETDFKVKVVNTELKALQAQMNPHFIFNSLNSINSYIIKNDTESATNYLTKFSKLVRKTLESSTEKEVLLKDDIDILRNYLDIENKRLNNSFTYAIKIDDAIDAGNTLIPPLILQPFLENSIWHGIAQMKNSGHISIEYKKENDMLFCIIDDNGVGRKKAIKLNKENTSLGINLTKSRIDIINAQNKTKGSLNIIDKLQGVRVEVKLPLILDF